MSEPTAVAPLAGIAAAQPTDEPPPLEWKECKALYPPKDEIARAFQDAGQRKEYTKKGKKFYQTRFPEIEKLTVKVWNKIMEIYNPDGMPKNVTRGKTPLLKEIVLRRKHVDASDLDIFFHPHSKDGKVFIISDNTDHCGLDLAISGFQEQYRHSLHQKNVARTCDDGIRLGCILLDPSYRDSVSGIMSHKKGRKKSDLTGDPNLHFFEKILTEAFLNPLYEVTAPDEEYYSAFEEDDKAGWDPNDPSIFEHTRDAAWLKATWDEYVKPKYKHALDKWNEDTGGGDGTPPSFVNFCDNHRWLVWIFCKDIKTNFLLGSNAGGRMPAHLQVEPGFDIDVNGDNVSSLGDTTPSASKRRVNLEDDLSYIKRKQAKQDKIDDAMLNVLNMIDQKQEREGRKVDQCIEKISDYSKKLIDNSILESMSPETKREYVTTLKEQRRAVVKEMKEQKEKANDNDD